MRATTPPGPIVQTASASSAMWSSTARETSPPPRGRSIRVRAVRLRGSTRVSVVGHRPGRLDARHCARPPAPTRRTRPAATSVGVAPVANVAARPVSGSTLESVCWSASSTQTAPAPAATTCGVVPIRCAGSPSRCARRPGRAARARPPPGPGASRAPDTTTATAPAASAAATAAAATVRRPLTGHAGDHRWASAARRGRVLLEDALLEVAQRGPGLQPELLVEPPPSLGEDLERLGLPAAAIEREHELAAQALAQRVLVDQRDQLREVGTAESELRVEVVLDAR